LGAVGLERARPRALHTVAGRGHHRRTRRRRVAPHGPAGTGAGGGAGERGEVPNARGAAPCRHLRRRTRRDQHDAVHQPADRADAWLLDGGVCGGPRHLAPAASSRRSRARAGPGGSQPRHGRAVQLRVPHGHPRRPGRVVPRPGQARARRGRQPAVPPGRHARHHRAQAGRAGGARK